MSANITVGRFIVMGDSNASLSLDAAVESGTADGKPVAAPAWIACARCDNRWTGLRAGQCGACNANFPESRGFDTHRRKGSCNDPVSVGLVPVTKKCRNGWAGPGDDLRFPDADGGAER